MTTINDSNVINNTEFTVDPRLSLPPGVVGATYNPDVTIEDITSTGDTEITSVDIIDIPTGALSEPTSITVVNQTVRVLPNGSTVIDVEVEIDDVAGAESFELRISKV